MHDVVVIGAGVGGLCAAVWLAAAGRSVVVLEAADAPGGKAGVVEVDGIELDTGPSLLTLPEVFADVFRLAGTRIEDELTLVRPSPSFRYMWPDGVVLDVHPDLQKTLGSVERALGAKASRELEAFLAYARSIWEAGAPAFVFGEAPSVSTLVSGGLAGLRAASRIDAVNTMWGSIRKRVGSPHLRGLLARYATYSGSDARSAPATLNCIAHVELALGSFGVAGGMYELVRALERACRRLGVDLRFGARVERIVIERGRAAGVEIDGRGVLRAGAVVANADAAHVAKTLIPRGTAHGIPLGGAPSTSGFNAIVRARRRDGAGRRVAHTVFFAADYEQELADLFDRDEPPREPTVYLCAQEISHQRRGWQLDEPLFVMANAPAEPASSARDARAWSALEHTLIDRLRGVALIGDDDRVVWRRTPADLAARFAGSRGALYGAASNTMLSAFARPANLVAKVPGLFLASGSAHPGGGLPLAALSGRAAARAALRLVSTGHHALVDQRS